MLLLMASRVSFHSDPFIARMVVIFPIVEARVGREPSVHHSIHAVVVASSHFPRFSPPVKSCEQLLRQGTRSVCGSVWKRGLTDYKLLSWIYNKLFRKQILVTCLFYLHLFKVPMK